MHFLFIISQNLSSAVQVLTTVREIDYQLNRAYITLVLLQCIGDVFCEARSRDVNSSEKTTKTTLASSSSLAPASGEVHDDADDDFCGSFSTTTITIRHSAASV